MVAKGTVAGGGVSTAGDVSGGSGVSGGCIDYRGAHRLLALLNSV